MIEVLSHRRTGTKMGIQLKLHLTVYVYNYDIILHVFDLYVFIFL